MSNTPEASPSHSLENDILSQPQEPVPVPPPAAPAAPQPHRVVASHYHGLSGRTQEVKQLGLATGVPSQNDRVVLSWLKGPLNPLLRDPCEAPAKVIHFVEEDQSSSRRRTFGGELVEGDVLGAPSRRAPDCRGVPLFRGIELDDCPSPVFRNRQRQSGFSDSGRPRKEQPLLFGYGA